MKYVVYAFGDRVAFIIQVAKYELHSYSLQQHRVKYATKKDLMLAILEGYF